MKNWEYTGPLPELHRAETVRDMMSGKLPPARKVIRPMGVNHFDNIIIKTYLLPFNGQIAETLLYDS